MQQNPVKILGALPLFSGLSEQAIRTVAERTVMKRMPRNRQLFRRGEPCHGLYVVVRGRIKVYRSTAGGREQILHLEGPGRPVAELPLFDGGAYPASARAIENSTLLFLSRKDFQWLYQNNPEIADAVMRGLGKRLRRLVRLVDKISLKDVPARVAATLLEYADAAEAGTNGGGFKLPRTQEEIAGELATTRESISRALKRLRSDGLIEQTGPRVVILDREGLQSVAADGRIRN